MSRPIPKLCLLLLFACSFQILSAQTTARVTITGQAVDTTQQPLSFATVMLLSPKDTTLLNFSRTDEKGFFSFKNVRNTDYLLKVTYIGYIPFQIRLNTAPDGLHAVGKCALKPITNELMEVVIKAAKAPLRIKGDTIEYDASSFKVPPGSTVEDLLRRLPGIEVDADGNIKAQGKDVKRVYVDGKTFFGDDPKAATKNLGSETISKIQVYGEQSEQAKITGVQDGKKEQAMNLELKDEYKKGSFGKVTAAAGTEETWAGRGNYNRFNDKQQLSFIGYGNNINQTGVNWEDYGEFKGQNAFNDYDNADFGFSSGRQYYFFDGTDSPMNNFDGRGFTKNAGGGANYNFDNKKVQYNASYFYNQTRLNLDQFGLRETFLDEGSFVNTDTTGKEDFRSNHNFSTRLLYNIDSSDILVVKGSFRYSINDVQENRRQYFFQGDSLLTNRLFTDNANNLDSWRTSGTAVYRHRFRRAGRAFAVSAGINNGQSDALEQLLSSNRFFQTAEVNSQFRQRVSNDNGSNQLKSSALFTESFGKRFFSEVFINASQSKNDVNRQARNLLDGLSRIDSLSVFYDNEIRYGRAGTSVRYSHNGLNASAGLAYQQIELKGQYARDRHEPNLTDPIDRTFNNWTPNVSIQWELTQNFYMGGEYSYSVKEPQFADLQPVPIITNPAFRTAGNPNLAPERSHAFDVGVNYWNAANFSNFNVNFDLELFDSRIVYNQTVEVVDSIGIVTTTRPDNLDGGYSFGTNFWSNWPIIKTKLTANVNGNFRISENPALVNGVRNDTRNRSFNLRAGLSLTPLNSLIVGLNGNFSPSTIEYSIQKEQNQEIYSYGGNMSVKWQFAPKTFLESSFNYSVYRNDRFDFYREIPLLNASVRRLLGKSNRIEVRLASFDALNRRVSITQNGTQNYVVRNIAPTLARYYMLSVSYNLRGYEDKLKKNEWW